MGLFQPKMWWIVSAEALSLRTAVSENDVRVFLPRQKSRKRF
jgi:hypothetical protein